MSITKRPKASSFTQYLAELQKSIEGIHPVVQVATVSLRLHANEVPAFSDTGEECDVLAAFPPESLFYQIMVAVADPREATGIRTVGVGLAAMPDDVVSIDGVTETIKGQLGPVIDEILIFMKDNVL